VRTSLSATAALAEPWTCGDASVQYVAVGMLPFSMLLYHATKKLINTTFRQNNQPALIAMIAAFITIITFSWGTWQPHALLTFSFFMGMILLSLNINTVSKNRPKVQDVQR